MRTLQSALAAASAVVAALALGGCGGPAPGLGDESGSVAGEIRLLTPIFEKADGARLLKELIGEFTAKYPQVKVSVDHTEYGKLNEKLTTSFASGRPYDVMLMGVGWVPPFADKGVLADFEEDPAELAKVYHERVVDAGIWAGRTYALPVMLDTRIGLYRKDIFAEAELTRPPRSFDEMRAYARALTKREPSGNLTRAGLDLLSLDPRQAFETLLWANGGELFTPDGKVAFNSPEGVGALQFMTDVIRTDRSEDVGFSQPGAPAGIPLLQGRAAMMLGHNNVWTEMAASAPDLLKEDKVGTFLIQNARSAMFQGGTLATVSSLSQHLAAAKALARFLASPEVSLRASEQRGNVPAATSVSTSDYVQSNKFVQFAMQNMDSAFSEGGVPAWLEIRGEFKATIESAMLGQKTPKQALDDLAVRAQQAMAIR